MVVSALLVAAGSAHAANGFIDSFPARGVNGVIANSDAAGTRDGTTTEYQEDLESQGISMDDFVSFTVDPVSGLAVGIEPDTTEAIDSDGDGIPDLDDACLNSDISDTVEIDGCDLGVDNILWSSPSFPVKAKCHNLH